MPAPPAFKDHFSGQADAYVRYRPRYPAALFDWLAAAAPATRLAVDVGAGNGQAAEGLAGRFDRVVAAEPSRAQLAGAPAHPRIEYRHEPAESLGLADACADLVVAAQAAHWFEWPRFVAEAERVLRPGGVLAIWCYEYARVTDAVDRLIVDFARDVVGPGWPRERRHVEEGYRHLLLPGEPLAAPALAMEAEWDAGHMLGYLDTWSSVRRCRARTGRDPLALLAGPLAAAWGEGVRPVRWPLSIKACRA